jgi:hypothetical protein
MDGLCFQRPEMVPSLDSLSGVVGWLLIQRCRPEESGFLVAQLTSTLGAGVGRGNCGPKYGPFIIQALYDAMPRLL